MQHKNIWIEYQKQQDILEEVSKRYKLPKLITRIILNRGLTSHSDILSFFNTSLRCLSKPFIIPDLKKASIRLSDAVLRNEVITLYGDYDVDGLTSTSLLYQFFNELGIKCITYIPNRLTEGHGLKISVLQYISKFSKLLVTVDCGSNDILEIDWANKNGFETIITDHHEVCNGNSKVFAFVNPKVLKCKNYSFLELSGVGVVLLLAIGIRANLRECGWFQKHYEPNLKSYLDLAALGTAADVVPIVRDNRIIVHHGLMVLKKSQRPGLIALKELVGLKQKHIFYQDLTFRLAPCLNAAGRLGKSRLSLDLLLSDNMTKAKFNAKNLVYLNYKRKGLEKIVLNQALNMLQSSGIIDKLVWVLYGKEWHLGVIGIVAARLTEKYHKPVAVVSLYGNYGRGSARSIEGFHIFNGLKMCNDILKKFGGHKLAAGFEIIASNLGKLQDRLEKAFIYQIGSKPLKPILRVDARVKFEELDNVFYHYLKLLLPFGCGNPEPILVCNGVECTGSWVVGEKHLKVRLVQNSIIIEAIAFNMSFCHPLSGLLDIVFSPRFSFFQGHLTNEFVLLDWNKI